jgi:hypothetical protein
MDLLSIQGTLNHFAVTKQRYTSPRQRALHGVRLVRTPMCTGRPFGSTNLGYFPNSSYGIGLRALLSLDDVEFDLVTLLEALVSIELNRAVVNKHVGAVVPANKTITLRVVEPLDFAFVLSHEPVDLP